MAKFYGKVGYGSTEEIRPGVWEETITEYPYYGDVIRDTRRLDSGEKVIPDISVQNSISIVADAFAHAHFFQMKYVYWMGARWIVSNVEREYPRLLLRLGGVYNGPEPAETP